MRRVDWGAKSTAHATPEELAAYVMDALEGDRKDAIERHVLSCGACAEGLAREAQLEVALAGFARVAVTTDARAAHVRQLRAVRARQHRWMGGVAGALAAAAAIVLTLAGATHSEPASFGAHAARWEWDDASEVSGGIAPGALAESGFVEGSSDKLDGG